MKVGIISFAHMHAWSYARCLRELGVDFVGIADDNEERGRKVSEAFSVPFYSTREDLLSQPLDVVIVCSENAKHKEDVLLSAKAGKHILCEKPIATSLEDAQAMIDACKEAKVFLSISFPCRYLPPVTRAKQLVDEGGIGEILAIKGTNRGQMPGGWFVKKDLAGGGAVMDHTVHVVDLMRWFLKDEVEEVYAEIDRLLHPEIEVDDVATLSLRFRNGVFATLDPSWSRPKSFPFWGDVTMEIIGTKGAILLDAFGQVFSFFSDEQMKHFWQYWGSDPDLLMIKDFLSSIEQGKEPLISGVDGLKALEVALAAYKSAENKEPVKLPL